MQKNLNYPVSSLSTAYSLSASTDSSLSSLSTHLIYLRLILLCPSLLLLGYFSLIVIPNALDSRFIPELLLFLLI